MSKELNLLSVGYYKGEMDFGVNGTVSTLTYEEMCEFRQMIVVAIGTAEDMWRRSQEEESKQQVTYEK